MLHEFAVRGALQGPGGSVRETRLDRLHLPEGAETAWEDRVRDRSYHPAARLIAAVAAAWLVAVTVIAALAYLTWLVAMTVEKRLGNLEDDLDDVDLLIAKYHNTSCSSFDRLTNASCAQVAQYDAVAGVASAASTPGTRGPERKTSRA